MKNISLLLVISTIFIVSTPHNLFSQCTNQVTHLSGTLAVSGVNVSVTSTGLVDTFTTYCANTFPYFIGAQWSGISGSGSYNFSFSPPIDSLTLNFSGITNVSAGVEGVIIFINGNHYSIPVPGSMNNCDSMAILTASGDIAACSGCQAAGWMGTTITGGISSLSVFDSVVSGSSGGSLFSLFISEPESNGLADHKTEPEISFYPNPFNNEIKIVMTGNEPAEIIFYDIASRELLRQQFTSSILLSTESFAKGIYLFDVKSRNEVIKRAKVVKN
jgi:hypothetical protein